MAPSPPSAVRIPVATADCGRSPAYGHMESATISDTHDAMSAITGIDRDPAKSTRATGTVPGVASASRDWEAIA